MCNVSYVNRIGKFLQGKATCCFHVFVTGHLFTLTSGFISHLFGDYKLLCEYQSLCSPLKIENISTLRNSFGLSLHFVYKMNTDVYLGKKVKDGPGPVLSLGFFSNIPQVAAAAK